MKLTIRILLSTALLALFSSLYGKAQLKPPVAPIVPDRFYLNGKTIQDDYSWMKDPELKKPHVLQYIQDENDYTDAFMKHTKPLQKKLFKEMNDRIIQQDQSVPYFKDGYFYYSRDVKGKQYPVYCRKKGSMKAKEEVILDVNTLAKGHEFYQIGLYEYSPDRRYLAFSVDDIGNETYALFIKDLETGKMLQDSIYPIDELAWANDNKTFIYTMLNLQNATTDKVYRHVLGVPQPDSLCYQEKDSAFNIGIGRSEDERQIVLCTASHTTSENYYVSADNPQNDFDLFQKRIPEIQYYISFHGDDVYELTNEDKAIDFKLLKGKWDVAGQRKMETVITASDTLVVSGIELFKNYLVVSERVNGEQRMLVKSLKSNLDHYIAFPEQNYSISTSYTPNYDTDTLRLYYNSFTTPGTTYEFNMKTYGMKVLKQEKVGKVYHASDYVSTVIYAKADDGTKIPIAVNYKKSLFKHDGSNPCYLEAYGSYGDTSDPYFSSYRLSLLDRGFVYAYAHIRGGGELGQKWHDMGRMLNKKNTFTDFITCAELLQNQNYTSKEKTVIDGGSAGGMLIGAVVNMRPELFRIAIAEVPFVDVLNTMLDPNLFGVVPEYEEWGNPNDPIYGEYIQSYCPYQNVKAQNYPTMLITEGLNDPRVNFWESLKWTAKLRSMKTDQNPLLLHMSMEGHLGASGRYSFTQEIAFQYAFILDQLGIK
ncbi:MAG TPA: S9 family peptidase [Candidatus Cloacimonadota bacterium]|nr:S9 family peptidase [Candidatus Cloacimonadota bacterium]HPT71176.1 S9 family peptidase [Candidatus Cloacimonadota bacterium]